MSTNYLNSFSVLGLQNAHKFSKRRYSQPALKLLSKYQNNSVFRIAPKSFFWVLIRASIVPTCFSCTSSY